MIKPSCINCEKRYLGCHDNCDDYKNFIKEKKKLEEEKKSYIKKFDYSKRLYYKLT